MKALRDELEIQHDEGGWRVGRWRNLMLTGLCKPPTAKSFQAIRKAQAALLEEKGKIGGLTLAVGLRLGPFDMSEAMRSELGQLMNVPNLRGHSAIVIESEGFAGATARAVLGAIILLARPDSPQKIFETRLEAFRWLHEHVAEGWRSDQLADVARVFGEGLGSG